MPPKLTRDRERFFALMQRYNMLGSTLPKNLPDPEDVKAFADAEMIVSEMRKVQAEMNEIMERNAVR